VPGFWPSSLPDFKWPRYALRQWLRRCLLALLFHLSHAAGRFVLFLKKQKPAILAIRTDGIGDGVLAEPLLHSLARRFADHQLHLWAPAATCELFRAAPYIARRTEIPRGCKDGNLLVFSSATWRMKLGYMLGRTKFAAAAYLAHSPEPLGNWLMVSARAARRWYSPGDTENQFSAQRKLTTASSTLPLPTSGHHRHDLFRNAELAHHWEDDIRHILPTVHLDDAAYAAAAEQARCWRRVAAWLGAEVVVGLMPAAPLSVKEYPASAWAEAAALLWQRGVICALLGSATDIAQVHEVSRRFGSLPHLRMNGWLDLPAMAALIGSLDGLLSIATGLAHISLAQDVPTVALVNGAHPLRYLPWPIARRAAVLNHAMPCAGCKNRCHLPEPQCLTRIDPADIAGAMAQLLNRPVPRPLRAVG
jgi:ADP-heptose:LPS heptosyltransferase